MRCMTELGKYWIRSSRDRVWDVISIMNKLACGLFHGCWQNTWDAWSETKDIITSCYLHQFSELPHLTECGCPHTQQTVLSERNAEFERLSVFIASDTGDMSSLKACPCTHNTELLAYAVRTCKDAGAHCRLLFPNVVTHTKNNIKREQRKEESTYKF